jgi:hypothetical protein
MTSSGSQEKEGLDPRPRDVSLKRKRRRVGRSGDEDGKEWDTVRLRQETDKRCTSQFSSFSQYRPRAVCTAAIKSTFVFDELGVPRSPVSVPQCGLPPTIAQSPPSNHLLKTARHCNSRDIRDIQSIGNGNVGIVC